MSVTIEYNGHLAEVPNSIWRRFEIEMAILDIDTDFLGEELDMVLDDEGYQKLVDAIKRTGSPIGDRIIQELNDPNSILD